MRKTYSIPCLVILSMLILVSCAKKPSYTYNVYFGSGTGCNDKGICLHPPAGATIPVTFTLLNPKLLQISFRLDDLKSKQPGKLADFYGKPYYTFDRPWKAPHIIDSMLHPTHPIFIWQHIKYTLTNSDNIIYMDVPLDGTFYSTTVRYGHGPTCDSKSICGSGPGIQGVATDFYYSKKAGTLALSFRMSELRGMQSDQADMMAGPIGFVPTPGLPPVTYPFQYSWTMPDDLNAALNPGNPPITIPANQPNPITTTDGENYTMTCYIAPGSQPPGGF